MNKKLSALTELLSLDLQEIIYAVKGGVDYKMKLQTLYNAILVTAGSGNVVGPGASVDNNVALFDGTTGNLLKDSGLVYVSPDFYKYSITTSVVSNDLIVTVLNYLGATPSAAAPIKYQDGSGTIRTISSALTITIPDGTNYLNCGSAELATKEIDFFAYFQWNTTTSATNLLIARFPSATFMSDITNSNTNEKGAIGIVNYNTTNIVVNIGRFNATLSAGAGYTWNIPATSVIINSPIYENQKQKNQLIVGEGINQSASYTTSVTMDFSSFTEYDITGQAGALLFNNPSGTPINGQKRIVRIKDNGTARALTYGTQFASGAANLLTTTVIGKKSWMGFEWDSTDSKWYCIAAGTQP